jgi:hypothetical protein|tara:strand:- start:5480 stop:5704 length:225 start_codon:yes stop_codon:yes gene_type:complete
MRDNEYIVSEDTSYLLDSIDMREKAYEYFISKPNAKRCAFFFLDEDDLDLEFRRYLSSRDMYVFVNKTEEIPNV